VSGQLHDPVALTTVPLYMRASLWSQSVRSEINETSLNPFRKSNPSHEAGSPPIYLLGWLNWTCITYKHARDLHKGGISSQSCTFRSIYSLYGHTLHRHNLYFKGVTERSSKNLTQKLIMLSAEICVRRNRYWQCYVCVVTRRSYHNSGNKIPSRILRKCKRSCTHSAAFFE
jgi:hypothetical protein